MIPIADRCIGKDLERGEDLERSALGIIEILSQHFPLGSEETPYNRCLVRNSNRGLQEHKPVSPLHLSAQVNMFK
jgi:hypothetical protein